MGVVRGKGTPVELEASWSFQGGGKRILLTFDIWLRRLSRWFSYFGGIALVCTAFIGVANIIANKVFGKSIANTNDLIDYSLILVVYCAVAHAQLGYGLLKVDIFSRKFPRRLNKGVDFVGSVMGAGIYAFAGYQAVSLLIDHYRFKTTAAASVNSFMIWPFTGVYVAGTFFLALALLWSLLRMLAFQDQAHESPEPSEVEDRKARNGVAE